MASSWSAASDFSSSRCAWVNSLETAFFAGFPCPAQENRGFVRFDLAWCQAQLCLSPRHRHGRTILSFRFYTNVSTLWLQ